MILMRILCVSDYHKENSFIKNVEKVARKSRADCIVNAGDFLSSDFAKKALENTGFRTFVVRGNWDYEFRIENKKVSILENEAKEFKGYHFLGAGFGHFSEIKKLAGGIDPKKLVLLTHEPPYDILDLTFLGSSAGMMDLRASVMEVKPILHVFGHIHESAGVTKQKGTLFVNAALPEFRKAVLVELPSQKASIFDV